MGLSYHFTFSVAASVGARDLVVFLKSVEADAKGIGFHPTMVLDAAFDTPERRVVRGVHLEDERMKGVVLPAEEQVWDFSPNLGHCRLAPQRAVILVVTDERGCETVFGFARYPETLLDIQGRFIMETSVGNKCADFEPGRAMFLGVHAERMNPRVQECAHGFLERFEIADHFVPVKVIGFENELDFATVAMGKFTEVGMLGEHVPAFDLKGFANSVWHSGSSGVSENLHVRPIAVAVSVPFAKFDQCFIAPANHTG